jgi:hypothetical protein
MANLHVLDEIASDEPYCLTGPCSLDLSDDIVRRLGQFKKMHMFYPDPGVEIGGLSYLDLSIF